MKRLAFRLSIAGIITRPGWRRMLVRGVDQDSWMRSTISRWTLCSCQFVLWRTVYCCVYFVQGLHGWYVLNQISLCHINIAMTLGSDLPIWLLILRRFGTVVSCPWLQITLGLPSPPLLAVCQPATPVGLDIKRGRLLRSLLHVIWLLAIHFFIFIAAVIVGVLVMWIRLAVFGTTTASMGSAADAGILPVWLSAFIDFLFKPRFC